MRILQAFSHQENKGKNSWVIGIGDDGLVYYWNFNTRSWILWGVKK